ncbi:MAG: VanZ family protein [Mycobacteriales bacterium]
MLFAPTAGGPSLFEGSDKVVHLVLFGLLAATTRWRFGPQRRGLVAVVAYAAGSEVVQAALLTNRSGEAYDVVADLLGAAAGWLLARRLLARRLLARRLRR